MDLNLSEQDKKSLLRLARHTIAEACVEGNAPKLDTQQYPDRLQAHRATFVTLQKLGELRGCIGSLTPQKPLIEDIAYNAFASAFRDQRFFPVTENELADLSIEISVLTPMSTMNVDNEEDLLSQLTPGVDGLLIQGEYHKATFLPQVWEQLPDPNEFLLHLKHKAGLQSHAWPDDMECFSYQCLKFKEED
ncbi:AmmeMemoRadiSam system protein A [Endozoicomonas arenosclerae]|uniref:AmmeMemoRadiSam system protein A n=1 Tax=Endozoicomonas arenosclerae TaxID=1633495 RepID=UPI0007844955|nr:AmmeMemoRadiSam system protein A [Endozoicomonas arenosclerae]